MVGTIVSILVAIVLREHPYFSEMKAGTFGIEIFIVATALASLFVIPMGIMATWLPLQRAEQNATPHISELLLKDRHLTIISAYLIIFAFLSLLVVPISNNSISIHSWVFLSWIVMLGLAVDAIRYYLFRIMKYLNPLEVVELFKKKALNSVQEDKELDLCHWLDGLSEISSKGIQHNSTALCHRALVAELDIARIFLEASKSISHTDKDPQTKKMGITDKVGYLMFFIYQRLDVIYAMALKRKFEMTCSHMITLLGKNSIDAAKYDISMASAPLRFAGKWAKHAQEEGLEESAITASCMFSEVSKTLLTEIDITYLEIKDPFLSIINSMEVLAKGAFKRDRTTNLVLLEQPFKDLRALFDVGKAKDHQDRAIIVQNIDRIIGEFDALLLVLNTMPAIPKIATDELPEAPRI